MINEGTIFYCHKTLITDSDDLCFIKGRAYEVSFSIDARFEFMNECGYEHYFSIDERNESYYKKWFYTVEYMRETKLKTLLDD